jgi:dihydrofolate reductase
MFNSVSLDGYFTDANNDMSWAHAGGDDPEVREFTAGNAKGTGALVFGRITYEMMASFWPTPQAAQMMPEVAAGMNGARKYVFSRSLRKADWALMVCPVILGGGRTLFAGATGRPMLKLANSRTFKNGRVFLHYTA